MNWVSHCYIWFVALGVFVHALNCTQVDSLMEEHVLTKSDPSYVIYRTMESWNNNQEISMVAIVWADRDRRYFPFTASSIESSTPSEKQDGSATRIDIFILQLKIIELNQSTTSRIDRHARSRKDGFVYRTNWWLHKTFQFSKAIKVHHKQLHHMLSSWSMAGSRF